MTDRDVRDATQPEDPTDRVLEPGGRAVTNLAGIEAPEETLERPAAISVEAADDPTGQAPLPPEANAAGEFVNVSAGQDVRIDSGKPPLHFVLPVPDDATPSNLALAILGGDRPIPGAKRPEDAAVWSVVPGLYEPDRGLFVVPLRFLAAEGVTVALVESEEYDAPSLSGSSDTSGSNGGDGLIDGLEDPAAAIREASDKAQSLLESGSKRDDFYVVCRGFDGGGCGMAEKKKVRNHLQSVHGAFSSDFRKPALRRTLPGRTVDGTKGRYYRYVIRPQQSERPCTDGDGLYSPRTRVAVTCHDPSESAPPEATTRMKYFHAIQFAYPYFDWRYSGESRAAWLLEGPATLAKNTSSEASRAVRWDRSSGSGDLRKVDTSLTARTGEAPFPAAGTQDFWVYLINSRDSSPKELFDPLWQVQIDDAPSGRDLDAKYDLSTIHWNWVRNQAFEAHETGGNSDLNGTCVPDSDAWASIHRTLSYTVSNSTTASDLNDQLELNGDWKAGIVKVEIENGFSGQRIRTWLEGNSDSGYVKAYPKRSSPGEHCLYRNESGPSTQISSVIEPGNKRVAYLLLSNSEPNASDKPSYDLSVTYAESNSDSMSPSVKILRPEAVDYALKRNTLFLEADARDPGLGFIEPLEWTVEGSGGTTATYRGNDLAIEDFWSEGFQAGTFTFEVLVKDDDGQETTVTFQADIEKK